MTEKPSIDCVGVFPTLPVGNVEETVEWYQEKLGFKLRFLFGDPPAHGAVELGQATVHFYNGKPNTDRHWIYFQIEDADSAYDWMKSNGVEMIDTPADQIWEMREFNLRDLNGYHLRFGAALLRSGEPVPVERVPLEARIERRLAGLLADLAEHKRMTIDELLEETLLHTFETEPQWAGKWVASPHTALDLRYIEQLKTKHGIDYETHDSYRFSEEKGT